MKNIYFIVLLLISLNTYSQISLDKKNRMSIPVELYKTTNELINDNIWSKNNIAIIKKKLKKSKKLDSIKKYGDSLKIESDFLQIKNFISKNTNEEFDDGRRAWGLKYNNEYYFNLGYEADFVSWSTFVKINIIGRYCLIFINSNTNLDNLIVNDLNGLGYIQNLLNSNNEKFTFTDKDNNEFKIFCIDTKELHNHIGARFDKTSISFLLTRKKLKKIVEKNSLELNTKEVTFDQVIELFKSLNLK